MRPRESYKCISLRRMGCPALVTAPVSRPDDVSPCPRGERPLVLAAEIVAADASVMDCLRLAAQSGSDLMATLRCRAQATSVMRQMRSALRDLQRMQAEREKTEATVPAPAAQAPQPTDLAETERSAESSPDRAERFLAAGGPPQNLGVGPSEPDVPLDERAREMAEA
jgi:hypothetical protein